MNFIAKYPGACAYLLLIIAVNISFPYLPFYHVMGQAYSAGDIMIGFIYVARDFAQREAGKNVLYLMALGCAASYLFTDQQIVIASIAAFIGGESIDWAIYTFSGKPFSQRLLLSSLFSVPVDSAIFLYFINQLNTAGMLVMILAKTVGVLLIWMLWRGKKSGRASVQYPA
jgi:queuosine precursor transporter